MSKHLTACLFASALFGPWAVAGSAQADTIGDHFVLKASGVLGWQVTCELTHEDGDTTRSHMRGRGTRSADTISVPEVVSGSCSYEVPDGGELRLESTNVDRFECPWDMMEDRCIGGIAGPAEGSLDIRMK